MLLKKLFNTTFFFKKKYKYLNINFKMSCYSNASESNIQKDRVK